MSQLIWIIPVVALLILIIYAIGSTDNLVKSFRIESTTNTQADQFYYLPTTILLIKATAKVIVTKNATDGSITKTTLSEIVLDTTVQIVPDTNYLLGLKYIPSLFTNDDVKLSVSNTGLIEGINLTAEDRISAILSQIAEAPKIILSGEQATESRTFKTGEPETREEVPFVTETREYINNFLILTKEIREKAATRKWIINVDGTGNNNTTVDASFTLKFDIPASPVSESKPRKLNGLLTRPLKTVFLNVHRLNESIPAIQYQLLIPDESSLLCIPITRSSFVKKTYGFKMANGMLTENTINKPSEVEGFLSIPINIAKAIVSVPAQLLSFKIENIKRQTAMETDLQALANARLQSQKNEIAKESELLKTTLEARKIALTHDSEIAKTKLEAEKMLTEAQKDVITTTKDLAKAKKELEELFTEIRETLSNKFKKDQE
jgi:hypothetical protein